MKPKKQHLYQTLSTRARKVMAAKLEHMVRAKDLKRKVKATLLEDLDWASSYGGQTGKVLFIRATDLLVAERVRNRRSLNRLAARCMREANENAEALQKTIATALAKIEVE